jgi:hypothetical protein
MKNATLERELEDMRIKGWVQIPDIPSFSVRMIAKIIDASCPLNAVSLRTIQRAIVELRKLGVALDSTLISTTPYFDRFSTELIILQLNFKVKQ